MRENNERVCVFIAGTHRSGTSALAGTIAMLGCDLPKRMLGPHTSNPKGHFEPESLTVLNEEILNVFGVRWDDWTPLPEDWPSSPRVVPFRRRLLDLVIEEYGEAPLFVLKEPRACRVLPLLDESLGALGAKIGYVLPFRHPLEVLASLQARNGFQPDKSILLWLRYMLDAERYTRGSCRCVLPFDRFLADWRYGVHLIEQSLDLRFPRDRARAAVEIEVFLEAELRHHIARDQRLDLQEGLMPLAGRVFQAHKQLANDPNDPTAAAALDDARSTLDDLCHYLAPTLQAAFDERVGWQSERQALDKRLDAVQQMLLDERVGWQSERQALDKRLDAVRQMLRNGEGVAPYGHDEGAAGAADGRILLSRPLEDLADDIKALQADRRNVGILEERVARAQAAVAGLEDALRAKHLDAERYARSLAKLQRKSFRGWLVARLPRSLRRRVRRAINKADMKYLRRTGLFDSRWYLQEYQDVADLGMDPLTHYVFHGAAEDRSPRPDFHTMVPLATFTNVDLLKRNPFVAFLKKNVGQQFVVTPIEPRHSKFPHSQPVKGNTVQSLTEAAGPPDEPGTPARAGGNDVP